MLTQGLAPGPKCELNITSFLTLPHPLHCAICAKDISHCIVALTERKGRGGGGRCEKIGGWFIYIRVWVAGSGQGVGIIFFLFFVLFL